jgi:hypothetical protein
VLNRRRDPREMNGGWQMDLFPVEVEPEPATTAVPDPAEQSPIGDQPSAAAPTAMDQEADQ